MISITNFKSHAKFALKSLILAFNKLHMTLVAKDKDFWMKKKINKIHFHPLTNHISIVVCD
jgi:hypothetical protein